MPQLHGNGQSGTMCRRQPSARRSLHWRRHSRFGWSTAKRRRSSRRKPTAFLRKHGALEAIPEYAAENAQFSGQSAGNLVDRIFSHDGYPDAAFRHPGFRKENPLVELNLNKVLLKNISDYLVKGIYDVAIAFDSEFESKKEITTVPLYAGKYQAVVSAGHPLFDKTSVTLAELYRHPLVMLDPSVIGASYDLMVQHAQRRLKR